ncbi:protein DETOXIFICATION 24-like [Populus alba x Populus x berolinensis]|nr:protein DETOXIFICATION 24-like [Populus alba x Populus x berolinensis]
MVLYIMDNSIQESLLVPEELSNVDLKTRIWTESKMIWKIAFPAMVARIGMSSATETLCGQAFGARHDHMMGIYLQRSWIVDGAAATILLPLVIFAAPIFRLLGQEEDVAIAAGNMSPWFIPYVYYLVFSLTIQMYLQAQLKNKVVGWFSAISFVLHILLSWIFVNKLELGTAGAMGALTISTWSLVIGLLVYIFGGWCPNTWKGFTKAAFADILPVVKLSISSATTSLHGNSCLALAFLALHANELGRGNAKAAKFFYQDYPQYINSVAVGAGVQSMVAFVNLGSYYIIGLPARILLGYVVHLEVQGLWMGLLSGVVVQTLILSYIIWRTDWDEQVNKASERLKRWFLKSEKDAIESSTPA